MNVIPGECLENFLKNGGAEEDRTPDLYTASVALSRLSYGPIVISK